MRRNILPTRSFKPESSARIEADLRTLAQGIAEANGGSARLDYERRYPAVVNTEAESALAARAAADVVGAERVEPEGEPLMGSEDFAFMLQARPGCYIWLGNGAEGSPGSCNLHNPGYDFNDEIAVIGASYWSRLVETALPRDG